jgi:hypothetical protein
MALLNISLVTEILKKLLEEYFKISDAWAPGTHPTISPQAPDQLGGDSVGIYLYHITENPHFKNTPPEGNRSLPVRYSPMGLNLFYQLSSKSATNDTFLEQKMMGIAVKAFHDYPIIDDSTKINGTEILPASLKNKDNRLRISLQSIAYNEAVGYWTAGSQPLRLAAYYQLSVVLLEPEKPTTITGRVLDYGVHAFVGGAPRVDSSINSISFKIPDKGVKQKIELQPAQVPPTKSLPADPLDDSRLVFRGNYLAGDSTKLLLKNARWEDPVPVDPAWDLTVRDNKVSVIVQQKIKINSADEMLLPGIYGAIIRVLKKRSLTDGSIKIFEHDSNESPFVIVPRIDSPPADDAGKPGNGGIYQIKGYRFRHKDIKPESVNVFVGGRQLQPGDKNNLQKGEFAVISHVTIRLRLPDELKRKNNYPLRIIINGAASPPRWLEKP